MKKSDMPFIDHLDELKNRLIKVLVVHLIVFLLAFSQSDLILEKIIQLNPEMDMIFVRPSEIFIVYTKISAIVAVALSMPFTIYHIWSFVVEGLLDNEKHILKIALAFGLVLFILGCLFGYFVFAPISLRFFTSIAIDEVSPMISVKAFVDFVIEMVLSMGIVFNMPSFTYIATRFGLISPMTIKKYYRHIIVVLFIIAGIITPPDVVSQIMVVLPMLVLFYISYLLSSWVYKRQKTKEVIE